MFFNENDDEDDDVDDDEAMQNEGQEELSNVKQDHIEQLQNATISATVGNQADEISDEEEAEALNNLLEEEINMSVAPEAPFLVQIKQEAK